MSSFDFVNYSLRPSKAIQRQLVIGGVRILHHCLGIRRSTYIGLGSVWFTDFVLAHELLGVDDLISMEQNDVGFRRALFNSPYATVQVLKGSSSEILPTLLNDEDKKQCPWIIWLDYDSEFDEVLKKDVSLVVEKAPINTTLLVTFNASEMRYGQAAERPERLKRLFGDVAPDDLARKQCKTPRLENTLADLAIDFMRTVAADCLRLGGFAPTVRMVYQDSATMVTVGGMLPSREAQEVVRAKVAQPDWRCRPAKAIRAPHLTIREALALQSMLPSTERLTRKQVQLLGFDLKEEQIEVFEKYYQEYPIFAQIGT